MLFTVRSDCVLDSYCSRQNPLFTSPELKALKVSLKVMTRAGVRPSVRASTLSNMYISETGEQIVIKFYLKHHCVRGKATICFGAGQIRTLVSISTD